MRLEFIYIYAKSSVLNFFITGLYVLYCIQDDVQNGYTPNIGFVHDEDIKSKCLDKLKQVWYVPRNFVDIPSADEDAVQLFGKGRYGPVYLSSMKTDGQPVTLYTVPASSFQAGGKHGFL